MISNCPLKFICSKAWSDLRAEGSDPGRRFCTDCKKPVYQCRTEAEFELRRRAGECVALDRGEFESIQLLGLPGDDIGERLL